MGKGIFRFGLARLFGGFGKASGADAKTPLLSRRGCSLFCVIAVFLTAMAISAGLFFAAPAGALYFERQQVTGFWLMDPSDVCSADIDGDGDMDIVATSITGNDVAWWENVAGDASQWAEFIVDGSYKGAQAVAVADIDGDGDMDIAACATDSWSSSAVWWENAAGDGKSWTKRTIVSPFGGAKSLLAADIDGDGDTDVAATAYNDDDLAWFENQGGGLSWQTHTLDADLDAAYRVEAGDLDGDGDTDILATASAEKRIV